MERRVSTLEAQYQHIIEKLESIETRLSNGYVSQDEFWPVKTIVYVGAGTVMLAVLTAVVALVLKVS